MALDLAAKVSMAVTSIAWMWVTGPLCRGLVLSAAACMVVGLSFRVMQGKNPAWKGRAGPGITAMKWKWENWHLPVSHRFTVIVSSFSSLLCRMGITFSSNDCGGKRQGIYLWNSLLEAVTGAEHHVITWEIPFSKKIYSSLFLSIGDTLAEFYL